MAMLAKSGATLIAALKSGRLGRPGAASPYSFPAAHSTSTLPGG